MFFGRLYIFMYYTNYEYTVKLLVSCALYNFIGG